MLDPLERLTEINVNEVRVASSKSEQSLNRPENFDVL